MLRPGYDSSLSELFIIRSIVCCASSTACARVEERPVRVLAASRKTVHFQPDGLAVCSTWYSYSLYSMAVAFLREDNEEPRSMVPSSPNTLVPWDDTDADPSVARRRPPRIRQVAASIVGFI